MFVVKFPRISFALQAELLSLLGFKRASFCLARIAIEHRIKKVVPKKHRTSERLAVLVDAGKITSSQERLIAMAHGVASKAAHGGKIKKRFSLVRSAIRIANELEADQ